MGCSQDSNPIVLQACQTLHTSSGPTELYPLNRKDKERIMVPIFQTIKDVSRFMMETQAMPRNPAHESPHPSQAAYSWLHPTPPCSNEHHQWTTFR